MILILTFSGSIGIRLTYSAGILIGIQNPSCVPFPHGVVAVVLNRVFVQNHHGGHEQTYFRREASEHLPC